MGVPYQWGRAGDPIEGLGILHWWGGGGGGGGGAEDPTWGEAHTMTLEGKRESPGEGGGARGSHLPGKCRP